MEYILAILILFCIYCMLSISVNFTCGNTGIYFIGHIAFFAIGAYSVAILSQVGLNVFAIAVIAILVSGMLALVLAFASARVSGHYLMLVSLGFVEIIRSFANNWKVTGGAGGILINASYCDESWSILLAMVGGTLLIQMIFFRKLLHSPNGRLITGVRDDALLLKILGRDVNGIKAEVLLITAAWSSIAGNFFAVFSKYIDPTSFTVEQSLLIYISILVGGASSFKGSFLAAAIYTLVPSLFRFISLPANIISPVHQILFGITVLVVLRFKPAGLFGRFIMK